MHLNAAPVPGRRRGGELDPEILVVTTMSLAVFAGVVVLWIAMANRRHLREMEHRERLAMIEKGLIPPPELDPAGFETRSGVAPPPSASRARSAGVMLIGLGFALILLIGVAGGGVEIGIGIGGAFAMVGAAFLLNAFLSRADSFPSRRDAYRPPSASRDRPPQPPPSSVS